MNIFLSCLCVLGFILLIIGLTANLLSFEQKNKKTFNLFINFIRLASYIFYFSFTLKFLSIFINQSNNNITEVIGIILIPVVNIVWLLMLEFPVLIIWKRRKNTVYPYWSLIMFFEKKLKKNNITR